MFLRFVGARIYAPNAEHFSTSEDRIVTAAWRREHLLRLQDAERAIQYELDKDMPEQVMIVHQFEAIQERELCLAALLAQLRCSSDPKTGHYVRLSTRSSELSTELHMLVIKLREHPLGEQYIHATKWLADLRFPCIPCDIGVFGRAELACLVEQALSIVKQLPGVTDAQVHGIQALFAALQQAWSARYLAVCRLFVLEPLDSVCNANRWPEFTDVTLHSSRVQDAILLLARALHAANNPCVPKLMGLVAPLQQVERAYLMAVNRALNCSPSTAGFTGMVNSLRCLLESNCVRLRELAPLTLQLEHQASDPHASASTREAALMEQDICARKREMEALKCIVSDRRGQLLAQLERIQCELKELSAGAPCDANDGPTTIHAKSRRAIPFAAECGERLEIELGLFEPGISDDFVLSVFPHHQQRIAQLTCEAERIRQLQQRWIKASARLSDMSSADRIALLHTLNEMEAAELDRIFLATGKALMDKPPANWQAEGLDALISQRLVCYWSKVLSNMISQLRLLTEEQSRGIVRALDNASTVSFDHFDYSMQGRYTFRIENLATRQLLYQTVQLNVLEGDEAVDTKAEWSKWARHYLNKAYEVTTDWRMPQTAATATATTTTTTTSTSSAPKKKKKKKATPAATAAAASPSPFLPAVDSIATEELGSHLLMYMQSEHQLKRTAVEVQFTGPNQWLLWLEQHGDVRARQMSLRARQLRAASADRVAKLLRKRGCSSKVTHKELLESESWVDFYSSGLFSQATLDAAPSLRQQQQQPPPPPFAKVGDGCDPCKTQPVAPENEARWHAKLGRAVERLLLRETPYFAFPYLMQCNYAALQCMSYERALSMRWDASDLAEADHTGLGPTNAAFEANAWLLVQLDRLRTELHLYDAIKDVHQHGPMLTVWYVDLMQAWIEFAKQFAAFDEWLDEVGCHADMTLTVDPRETATKLRASLESAMNVLIKALHAQSLPRCVYSTEEIQALFRQTVHVIGTGTGVDMWRVLVEAHRYVIHFHPETPWGLVVGNCAPEQWYLAAVVLANRGEKDVMHALEEVDRALRDRHLPALRDWLQFQLDLVMGEGIYSHGNCIDDVLKGSTLQSGLREDVRSRNAALDALLKQALAGERLATSYEALVTDASGGPLNELAKAVREAMQRQPEIASLKAILTLLHERYVTADLQLWRTRVSTHPNRPPRDFVTAGMADYADRWSHNPLDDAIILLRQLEGSDLLRIYSEWLGALRAWIESLRKRLFPGIVPDCVHWLSQEILARCYGAARLDVPAYPPLPPTNERPTMARLVTRYRDVLYQVDSGRYRYSSDGYFDLMLRLGILFKTIASELDAQLNTLLLDMITYKMCLPARCFGGNWSDDVAAAASSLLDAVAHDVRLLELADSDMLAMFDSVIHDYEAERERLIARQRHADTAISQRRPWLDDSDPYVSNLFGPARARLHEVASLVYAGHLELNKADKAIALMLARYHGLYAWLQTHYVNAVRVKQESICVLKEGFVLAKHEIPLAHLSRAHLEQLATHKWSGTLAELGWSGLGAAVWARVLEIETQLLELVYDSPSTEDGTPEEHWAERNAHVLQLGVGWAREQFNDTDLTKALEAHLRALYLQYGIVSDFLHGENSRESFVLAQSLQRTVMLWEWLHRDLVALTKDDVLTRLLLANHVDLDKLETVPTVSLAHVDALNETLTQRRGLLAMIPGVADAGQILSSELYPMNDLLLTRLFYAALREESGAVSIDDPQPVDLEPMGASFLTGVVNVLRHHAARRAVRTLTAPEVQALERVIAGVPTNSGVDHAGGATYYDALGSFFYYLQVAEPKRIRALLALTPNVFGHDESEIHSNFPHDHGRYSAYVRGTMPKTLYVDTIVNQLRSIQDQSLKLMDAARATETFSQQDMVKAWRAQREALWWVGFTETLEAKQFNAMHWFFEQWLPAFAALDHEFAFEDPLFSGLVKRMPTPATAATVDHVDVLYWMQQSVLTNAEGGISDKDKQLNVVGMSKVNDDLRHAREELIRLRVREQELLALQAHELPEATALANAAKNADLANAVNVAAATPSPPPPPPPPVSSAIGAALLQRHIRALLGGGGGTGGVSTDAPSA